MAPRPYWKGYLKLSLVTCPVSMSPATSESDKVRFHTLNKETGNRVVSQYVDTVTRKPVKDDDEVKGYARGENDHVLLTDDELDAVALDTVKTIDIDKFVPRDSIDLTAVRAAMTRDKKKAGGEILFALPASIGDVRTGVAVSNAILDSVLRA